MYVRHPLNSPDLTRPSPVLFLATIIIAFLIMMSGSDAQYLKYTTVTGFFQQDDPSTDPKGFDYVRLRTLGVLEC
jgi:hypothetical protein